MPDLGTRGWTERTGGRLGYLDRLTLIANAVALKLQAKTRSRPTMRVRYREVADLLPPDSAIAREAFNLSCEMLDPYLHHHNLRAYFWARLLDDGKQTFDDEATFVAIMLHDLGLAPKYSGPGRKNQCFTIVGAAEADALAQRHGWSDRRAAIAANAITLHLNVVVAEHHGREASMVRLGSGADAAGFGLGSLHHDQLAEVVAMYPRLNFKQQMLSTLRHEGQTFPEGRMAFMLRTLKFGDLISDAKMFSE